MRKLPQIKAYFYLSRFSHTLKKWAVLVALNDCTISMLARLHQSTIAGLQRLVRMNGEGGGRGVRLIDYLKVFGWVTGSEAGRFCASCLNKPSFNFHR